MTGIQTISVRTSPSYDVLLGSGLHSVCGQILRPLLGDCRLAVITDSTVAPLFLKPVEQSLRDAGFSVVSYIFSAGESHKHLGTLSNILEFLGENHLTRSDCIVALGGGVCGDMAGCAAAVYLRGIRYVQLPTTLLSAVDSSVGGKTAIDLSVGKNLVGAFLQPAAVLCDTDCLHTLPPLWLADGASEAVKTGVLTGEALFSDLEQGHLESDPASVIAQCVAYKAGVVERDEKEQGERRLLNLGHTVGHAVELCSSFSIPHGHAVAAGLAIIARSGQRLGWTEEAAAQRICACLTRHRLPTTTDFSAEDLAEAALSDKKRAGDTITLVIPRGIGQCIQKTIPVSRLAAVIAAGLEA